MKSIRKQDFAILIVTNEYLQSRNCMFEVLELLKKYEENEESFYEKTMILVTANNVHSPEGKREKIQFWVDESNKYEKSLINMPASSLERLSMEAKKLKYISMEIGTFLDYLSDNICDDKFEDFIRHTREKIDKWALNRNNSI